MWYFAAAAAYFSLSAFFLWLETHDNVSKWGYLAAGSFFLSGVLVLLLWEHWERAAHIASDGHHCLHQTERK